MHIHIERSWKDALASEFEKPYFKSLSTFIRQEIVNGQLVFPLPKDILAAFDFSPLDQTKVVILGQDPYHSYSFVDGKQIPTAHGLCFSVVHGAKTPPSLQNIYKELQSDLGADNFHIPNHGNLTDWARQGVLLLNSTLTVKAHAAMSHTKKGWEEFTDSAIRAVSEKNDHVVFLLWGRHAQAKKPLINAAKHRILEAAHPSPFSANNGFFGCKHFSKTNQYLVTHGKTPIHWSL